MSLAQPQGIPVLSLPSVRRRWPIRVSGVVARQGVEALVLLCLFLWLVYDRWMLSQQFLFRYSDEDQTLLWLSAKDLLHGMVPEPCFYGQSFNSCLEGYLASPLILVHALPYWMAVPLVSIILGLFPFLAIAWMAWRRGHAVLAAGALLTPLVLPVRYAMLTGMPRGFVTGIAVAMIPCLLLLKDQGDQGLKGASEGGKAAAKHARRRAWRYFFMGLLAVVALMLNPNCGLLLAPALVYAIATRWKRAEFWLYSSLGTFLGAFYPLGVFFFYFRFHDDYRLYHRDPQFDWTFYDLKQYLHQLQRPLGDFVPVGLPTEATTWVLLTCFGGVLAYLLLRRRWAAALATLTAVGIAILSLGFARVHEGKSSVMFSYSRMYLAVPVLPALLLLWGSSKASHTIATARSVASATFALGIRWTLLAGSAAIGFYTTQAHAQAMPDVIAWELNDVQIMQLVDVEEGRNIAQALQAAADAQNAHFVLLPGNQRGLAYLLPALTNCQTLFPPYERRTWVLQEESFPRYPRILVLDRGVFDRARRNGFPNAVVASESPFIGAFDTKGKSVLRICQDLGVTVRAFRLPAGSDVSK